MVNQYRILLMIGHFAKIYKGKGLQVNAGKNTVMVLGGKEGLVCNVWR